MRQRIGENVTQRDALSLVARNVRNCSFRNRSKFTDVIVTRLPKVLTKRSLKTMTICETEPKQTEVCLYVVRVYSVRRRTNVRTQYEVFLAWLASKTLGYRPYDS